MGQALLTRSGENSPSRWCPAMQSAMARIRADLLAVAHVGRMAGSRPPSGVFAERLSCRDALRPECIPNS